MSTKIPDPKGKDDNGCCPSCGNSRFDTSEPYEHPALGEKVRDEYCLKCGSVVEQAVHEEE